jgi:hypothetical protein
MKQRMTVLLACVFVVMIGLGITLPVLPFYVERLALFLAAAAIVGWLARSDREVRWRDGTAQGASA